MLLKSEPKTKKKAVTKKVSKRFSTMKSDSELAKEEEEKNFTFEMTCRPKGSFSKLQLNNVEASDAKIRKAIQMSI